jgi:outer membrane protein OmpU
MEINMKNVTKAGISALAGALAFTSANAGDVSITGSMIASYTNLGGYNTTGNPFGLNKELSITGSGELDNGTSVAYKQTVTNALGYNDSELVFTGLPMMGDATLALTSTGDPMSAIDDVTPIAFEEASAAVGSLKDVNGVDGTYGLRYTLADIAGSGMTLDAMYVYEHGSGDAQAEKGTANNDGGQEEGYSAVVKGSVPMIEGLDIGVGYAFLGNSTNGLATNDNDQHEGTAYLNYAIGSVKVGVQKGVVDVGGTSSTTYTNEYIGVSYAVSDNLSISYNEIESNKNSDGTNVDQEFDSISLSYTAGGMTLGVLDSDVDNASYTSAREQSARAVQMTIAF